MLKSLFSGALLCKSPIWLGIESGRTQNCAVDGSASSFSMIDPSCDGHFDCADYTALNPKLTFDNFIEYEGNKLAIHAAKGIITNTLPSSNLHGFYGDIGLGKTHLIHAIGNAFLAAHPDSHILLLSNGPLCACNEIRYDKIQETSKYLLSADMVLFDDFQYIAHNVTAQQEFYMMLYLFSRTKGKIVMMSNRSPARQLGVIRRLRSLCGTGIITEIGTPDFAARTSIILEKARRFEVEIPEDVVNLLASATDNIRSIEGAIIRLAAVSQVRRQSVDMAMAKSLLRAGVVEKWNTVSQTIPAR
ncbi:MAG: hypothetical protein HZA17_02465 [Nitrospirae bacterium]|nr:hypothetical protein [Nitrospirota bacterium]